MQEKPARWCSTGVSNREGPTGSLVVITSSLKFGTGILSGNMKLEGLVENTSTTETYTNVQIRITFLTESGNSLGSGLDSGVTIEDAQGNNVSAPLGFIAPGHRGFFNQNTGADPAMSAKYRIEMTSDQGNGILLEGSI